MENHAGFQILYPYAICFISTDCKEWKLTPTFLQKFKVLESHFRDLLPSDNIVRNQFELFLAEWYGFVKNMNETEFMKYVINVKSAGLYDDFVRYKFLNA